MVVPPINKAVLIFNPAAGPRNRQRDRDIRLVRKTLSAAGVTVELAPTQGPGTATVQTLRLLQEDFDTLIACGGDGTINEVVQGVATSRPQVQLGIIPMGCANILATELRIPSDPAAAARALLAARPRRLPIGIIEYRCADNRPGKRYWVVATGIGVDAQVIWKVHPRHKAWFGMRAYYLTSLRCLLSREIFNPFVVKWNDTGSGQWREEMVTQVVAARVTYFGRCLKDLILGQELECEDMQVILFKFGSRLKYLRYGLQLMGRSLIESPKAIQGIEFIRTRELLCQGLPISSGNGQVLAETDGEVLGRLPVRVSIASDTVLLLCPHVLSM
jgi:diacylglycerol kinase (ATP)